MCCATGGSNRSRVGRASPGGISEVGLHPGDTDGDGEIGVHRRDRRDGQRVGNPAVGEQTAVEQMRRDHPGNGDRRADRLVDGAALQPPTFPRSDRW